MPTKRPTIVYALPPNRNRRPKAKPADMPKGPVIVEARDPRRIRHEPKLATRIVDHSAPDTPEDEQHQRGDAADRLWAQMVQDVKRQSAADQPASRKKKAPHGGGALSVLGKVSYGLPRDCSRRQSRPPAASNVRLHLWRLGRQLP